MGFSSTCTIDCQKYFLQFIKPGGTSRGVLRKKESWFLRVKDLENDRVVWSECGILRGLSYDDRPEFEQLLGDITNKPITLNGDLCDQYSSWPSIRFGLEMAMIDLQNEQKGIYYNSDFTAGLTGIKINGLIWMSTYKDMIQQVQKKMESHFSCIKIKIGAIDWNDEFRLIKKIRSQFASTDLEIRVDANGAFQYGEEVYSKLEKLAALEVHSIEQPIKAGQWEHMADLCKNTPIPIALDEELIGITNRLIQKQMLNEIKPQFIILKPSLLGGFKSTSRWIELAKESGIRYWMTSALESNIGLNAIAQYTYQQGMEMAQGLGTGMLYTNNVPSPLYIKGEELLFNPNINWDYSGLKNN